MPSYLPCELRGGEEVAFNTYQISCGMASAYVDVAQSWGRIRKKEWHNTTTKGGSTTHENI